MNWKIVVLSCTILLFLISPIYAAEGTYISVIGVVSLLNDTTLSEPRIPYIADTEFDTGFGFGAAIGYDLGVGRVESEFGYRMHDIDKFEALGVSIARDGDINTLSFLLNGFYDIKTQSPFTPYVGGGIGIATINVEDVSVAGIIIDDSDDTVFAYQLGGGLGYTINESLTLDVGYRYFATSDPDFNGTEVEYGSHNLSLALRISFQ